LVSWRLLVSISNPNNNLRDDGMSASLNLPNEVPFLLVRYIYVDMTVVLPLQILCCKRVHDFTLPPTNRLLIRVEIGRLTLVPRTIQLSSVGGAEWFSFIY
ncbi:MAG: hypothetical protein QGI29_06685, partial [Pirellulales bacterium]|nr:hypothetical protein [Pirellulales bacterium]